MIKVIKAMGWLSIGLGVLITIDTISATTIADAMSGLIWGVYIGVNGYLILTLARDNQMMVSGFDTVVEDIIDISKSKAGRPKKK